MCVLQWFVLLIFLGIIIHNYILDIKSRLSYSEYILSILLFVIIIMNIIKNIKTSWKKLV